MDSYPDDPGGIYGARRILGNKNVIRSVKLVFSTNVIFLLFSIATSLLSAWALGPEGRGDLVVVTTWLFVFSLFGMMGLPVAKRYWTAKEPAANSEIFTNTIVFSLVASAIIFVIGWLIVPLVINEQKPHVIRLTQVFLLNIPVILLSEMLRGQLEGARLFGWLGAARISFIAFQAIVYTVYYLFHDLTLEHALWVIVVGQIICLAVMFYGVWVNLRPRWSFKWKIFGKEIHYGLRGYLGNITEFAVWRLDQMMLTAMAASSVIGLYAVAVAIAEITATLASSISDALLPEVAASKEKSESILLLGKSLRLTLYAQIVATIPIWITEPYVLLYVFGENFLEASGALRLLLIASIFWSAGLIVISGLNGFGRPGLSAIARIASAATTVLSLVLLLPVWGIKGAAVASIFGYSVMFAVALVFLLRTQKISFGELLRPRADDISIEKIKSVLNFPAAASPKTENP